MRSYVVSVVIALAAFAPPARGERRTVGAEEVRAAIAAAVHDLAPKGTTVEMRQGPILVADSADGPVALEVALPDPPLLAGVRAVPVSCRAGGRVVSRGLATLVVRREIPVWVVARPVTARATLVPEDVRRERRVFEREPSNEVLEDLEPGRFTARHALAEDAVLKTTDLIRRPDVTSGAPIALVARAGSAAVTVAATARRSGNVGETILVANPLTGDVVEAVVVDARTAELVRVIAPRRPGSTSRGGTP
ncbi:MAG: flagellar basal body P-ring formation chaperone FlgA [bacterium]